MWILILIDVQYSQKAVFNFEKGSNHQNYSSSRFLQPVKKTLLPNKVFDYPPCHWVVGIYSPSLTFSAIWKTLACVAKVEFQFVAVHKGHESVNHVNKGFETNKDHGIENLI